MLADRTILRVLLLLLSADAIIGTLMIVLGGRGTVVWSLPDEAKREATDLFVVGKLETAAFRVGLAVMWLLAVREPEKNRAVIVGTSIGLVALGFSEVVAPRLLDVKVLYPTKLVWGHAIIRWMFAAALFVAWRSLTMRSQALEENPVARR